MRLNLLIFVLLVLFFGCGQRKLKETTIIPQNFIPDYVTMQKDIHVRAQPSLKSKIIDVVIKGETMPVYDVFPKAMLIEQTNRRGWIVIKDLKDFDRQGDQIYLHRRFNLYNVSTQSNLPDTHIIGIARSNAVYRIKDIIPRYYKIKLDNNNKGWIYAGHQKQPWVQTKFLKKMIRHKDYTNLTDNHLILWNTLESEYAIKNSRIGIRGIKKGDLIFVDGGVLIDEDEEYIDFYDHGKLLGPAGTVELVISPKGWTAQDGRTSDGDCKWLWQICLHKPPGSYSSRRFRLFDFGFAPHQEGFMWRITQDGKNWFGFGKNPFLIKGLNLDDGKKYRLSFVWDENGIHDTDDTCRIYLDGELLIATRNKLKIPKIKNKFRLGNSGVDYFRATDPFDGIIYDLRVYDYAKTDFVEDRFSQKNKLNTEYVSDEKGLIFWNTMDNEYALRHSLVGPGFDYIHGIKEFAPVKFGNGVEFYYRGGYGCAVLKPVDLGNMSSGCVEFWYLSNEKKVKRSGGAEYLFALWSSPSYYQQIALGWYSDEGCCDNYGLSAFAVVNGQVFRIMTGVSGDSRLSFSTKIPMHIAYVWNWNGIGNTDDTMRVYLNGKKILKGQLTGMRDLWDRNVTKYIIRGPGDYRSSWVTAPNGKVDNLKIYNYAKTNFVNHIL